MCVGGGVGGGESAQFEIEGLFGCNLTFNFSELHHYFLAHRQRLAFKHNTIYIYIHETLSSNKCLRPNNPTLQIYIYIITYILVEGKRGRTTSDD